MTHRCSIYVIQRTPHPSPAAPNATVAEVTTEIRLFYPPDASVQTLLDELSRAHTQARDQLVTGRTD